MIIKSIFLLIFLFAGFIPSVFAGNIIFTYDNAGRLIKADYGGLSPHTLF